MERLEGAPSELGPSLELVATSSGLREALLEGTASDTDAAQVARLALDADVVVIAGPDGTVQGSYDRTTDGPLPPGNAMAELGPVRAAVDGREAVQDLVRARGPELLAVASQPVFPVVDGTERRDQLAGVVVAATRVARTDRVDQAARQVGADVAVVVGGSVVAVSGGPAAEDPSGLVSMTEPGRHIGTIGDETLFVQSRELTDTSGQVVARVLLFEDAGAIGQIQRLAGRILLLAAVAGGLLATLLAAAVTTRTVRPVQRDLREGARRESTLRGRLDAVTSSMEDGLLALDDDGRIALANPALEELVGAPESELLGRSVDDVLGGTTASGTSWGSALAGAHDEVVVARGQVPTRRGEVSIAATSAPLRTDDQDGRVVVLRDVTADVEMQRAKDEFVSTAAHELRTPLTPVVGYLKTLLTRPKLSAAQRTELLGEAAASAEHLQRVVDQLVWFADLQVGRAALEPEPVQVADLVDDLLERWRAGEPDRSFRRRLSSDLPAVLVDPTWTGRALDELVANALDFSDGPVLVTGTATEDGRVRIGVRDRGEGIAPDRLEVVRQAFRQADGSTTRSAGGLGLGLAVVDRILMAQDGGLRIDSVQGKGTLVQLDLPTA